MNSTALALLIACAGGILLLPRRWAPIPLLAACCYMTVGQGLELGSISLPMFRICLAVGLLRVFMRRERLPGALNTIDKLIVAWGCWLIFASLFHEWAPGSGPTYATGVVLDIAAIYFLIRIWCSSLEELVAVIRVLGWLLVPVAAAMVAEHVLQRNLFAAFGGVSEGVFIRDGKIRAQGPFQHPILAGTVGAVCFPLMAGIWRRHWLSALVGMAAATVMVLASTSSGPLMSLVLAVGALCLWWRRSWLPALRWAVVGAYLSAEVLMSRPAYYLISKIDLTGSSTSWYRSRLIESAFEHLGEWWLFGTDNTGHWMANPIDSRSSDITNYYIFMGTIGGLAAMILLITIFWRGFLWVGKGLQSTSPKLQEHRFMIWCLGAGLFAHAATSVSVAYFDQSMMFIWLNIGVISSMYSVVASEGASRPVAAGNGTRGAVPSRRFAGTRSPKSARLAHLRRPLGRS